MSKIRVFFVCESALFYYPLALGILRATLARSPLGQQLQIFPLAGLADEQLVQLARAFGPGVWLFSNYVWSERRNLFLAEAIKRLNRKNVIFFGGPSCPKSAAAAQGYLQQHPCIDLMARGEAEQLILDAMRILTSGSLGELPVQLSQVAGLVSRLDGELHLGPARSRTTDLDSVESPYLNGTFDKLQQCGQVIETNRGCPYSCAFCDWGGLVEQKIKVFALERVQAEIEWGARRGVPGLLIADANFGILDRDLQIAEFISQMRSKYGYPRTVGPTFAKNVPDRVVEIARIFQKAGIRSEGLISIQTTDQKTLDIIGRSNIKTKKYDQLLHLMRDQGIPIVTDLMVGLPGQTLESFKRDLQSYFDRDVRVQIWPTLVLPNSRLADPVYQATHGIVQDKHGFVVQSHSFTAVQRTRMLWIRSLYLAAENFSYLRYYLRYLQWSEKIAALEFLDRLVEEAQTASCLGRILVKLCPDETFSSLRSSADVTEARTTPFRLEVAERAEEFYQDLVRFTLEAFAIEDPRALGLAAQVNQAVVPNQGRTYPFEIELEHDFSRYFADRLAGKELRLQAYGPTRFVVEDRQGYLQQLEDFLPKDFAIRELSWELHSPLIQIRGRSKVH